jgi:hypothetical protein
MKLDWQKNSKTKVEKAFSHVFLCGSECLGHKKVTKYGLNIFFSLNRSILVQKILNFTLISKRGKLPFEQA